MEGLALKVRLFSARESNPKSAALHLKIVHQTYKELATMKNNPVFVVIFTGPSVKLISKNREGFSLKIRNPLMRSLIQFQQCRRVE
jgi:hypothetical protein